MPLGSWSLRDFGRFLIFRASVVSAIDHMLPLVALLLTYAPCKTGCTGGKYLVLF